MKIRARWVNRRHPPTDDFHAKELEFMPHWLCLQLQRAFRNKDRRQIRWLNDCWFFYRGSVPDTAQDKEAGESQ
jgi:hypothetical protein